MKSIGEILNLQQEEKPTAEATERMLAECREDEYVKDGMIYCKKCHQPRRRWIPIFNSYATVLCKCQAEEHEQQKAEQEKRERIAKIARYRNAGFKDKDLQNCRFEYDDSKDSKASMMCRKYAENFSEFKKSGKGLILFGGVGTGKTYLASCIANELIDRSIPCMVTNFTRIINTLQGMFDGKQEYLDSLNEFDLLVIDDLGIERNTEYVNELVYNIIDARYRSGKPMIVTTNLKLSDLHNATETSKARIYSRIIEMCLPVLVDGEDRRKNRAKDIELMDILNS